MPDRIMVFLSLMKSYGSLEAATITMCGIQQTEKTGFDKHLLHHGQKERHITA